MRRVRGLYIPLIGLVIAGCCLLMLSPIQNSLAQSSSVEVTVPDTAVLLQGTASPNAQVIAYVNGTQTASTIANPAGYFVIEIGNQTSGTINVAAEAIDQNGVTTAQASRDVAVQLQQTSVVSFFLAPTISAQPTQRPFGNNSITFRGYSAPGANITITIANGLSTLTTQTNSQGFYGTALVTNTLTVGVFSYSVSAQIGVNESEADTIARQFNITPPVAQPESPPTSSADPAQPASSQAQPAAQTQPSQFAPPTVSSPPSGATIESSATVFQGSATPGSEILVYDNGELIGVVITDSEGNWEFYFQANQESHQLQFQTCIEDECSDIGDEINLNFALVRGECQLDIRLQSYRLSAVRDQPVAVQATDNIGATEATATINWGDGTEQRFDIEDDSIIESEYSYDRAGVFNGYIVATDQDGCSDTAYFTVRIAEPLPATTSLLIAVAIAMISGVAVGMLILRRRLA